MTFEGATDPGSYAELVKSFGPTAAVLACFVLLIAALLFGLVVFVMWWRGVDRWGIIGAGKEYQLTRMAHERTAKASEETRADQHEIKAILARFVPLLEVFAAKFSPPTQGVQPDPPRPPLRASSPELGPQSRCTP